MEKVQVNKTRNKASLLISLGFRSYRSKRPGYITVVTETKTIPKSKIVEWLNDRGYNIEIVSNIKTETDDI